MKIRYALSVSLVALLYIVTFFVLPSYAVYGDVSTIAGTGTSGATGDGGQATSAQLGGVGMNVFIDASGNLFIADSSEHVIRKVDSTTGVISTVAGDGTACGTSTDPCGDGGLATSAQLNNPFGVTADGSGNLFIADKLNNKIRRVDAGTGVISTIAGTGIASSTGDTSLATLATLNNPSDLIFDSNGNLYIAEQSGHKIRKIDTFGTISLFAGTGVNSNTGDAGLAINATFSEPTSIEVDSNDDVYVSSQNMDAVRKITVGTGLIDTIAGSGSPGYSGDGGPATSSVLNNPSAITIDTSDNIYISDTTNHRVRKIDAATGNIATFAGDGTSGFSGDGASALSAQFNNLLGIAVDSDFSVFVYDAGNIRVRRIEGNPVQVLSVTPSIHENGVSKSSNIVIILNDSINPATVTQSNFPVYGSLSGLIAGSYTLSTTTKSNDTITFDPTSDFVLGDHIRLTVRNTVLPLTKFPLTNGYVAQFHIEVTNGTAAFVAQPSLSAQNPIMNKSADLDNDGDIDIVSIGGGSPGELEVFLNNGNGTFASAVVTGISNNPRALTLGDFDSDGFVDVAGSYLGSSTFSIFLNSGSGSFPTRADYGTSSPSLGIGSADFDADGDLDVVLPINASNTLSVFVNNGSGIFSFSSNLPFTSPAHVDVADVDLDGDMDIAASSSSTTNVGIFINNGDGSFASADIYAGSGTTYLPIVLKDLDGDRYPEIISGNFGANVVSIFPNDGDGTYSSSNDVSSNKPEGLDVNDFDGDGDMDLAVVDNSNAFVRMYLNDGSASFTLNNSYAIGSNPSELSSGDFNGDGAMDISVSSTNSAVLSILFNTPTPLAVVSVSPTKNAIDVTKSSTIQLVFDQTINAGTVNQTNLPIWGDYSGLIPGSYSVVGSTVTFTPTVDFHVNEKVQVTVSPSVLSTLGRLIPNGYTTEFVVETTFGTGDFSTIVDYTTGTNSAVAATVADLDNDGDLDFVVSTAVFAGSNIAVYFNNGNASFTHNANYTHSGYSYGISDGDFNNDGFVDLVISNGFQDTITVRLNDGSGGFATSNDYLLVGADPYPMGAAVGDYNGDGHLDIATAQNDGFKMSVLINKADGSGTFNAAVDYAIGSKGMDIAAGDFDNDADLDVVVMGANNAITVLMNNGDGTFAAGVQYTIVSGGTGSIASADINADGFLDLLISTPGSSKVQVFLNSGTGTFPVKTEYDVDGLNLGIGLGDFDADGDLDAAVSVQGASELSILTNLGAGVFGSKVDYAGFVSPRRLSTGDFDNNGSLDLVVSDLSASKASVLLNTANQSPTVTTPSLITQAIDASGHVSFQATVTDADTDLTRLQVQYSDDGGSNFYDTELISASPDSGTVDLNNAVQYQVGSTDAIDTNTGARVLTIVWDTKSAGNGNGVLTGEQSDIQIRVTPNDSTISGASQTTASFTVDNQIPVGLTELTAAASTTSSQELEWTAVTESNFDHYEIWYGESQTDVVNRSGTAIEWDNSDDAALTTISTTSTDITGLDTAVTYFFKVFAIDSFGNIETVLEISLLIPSSGRRRRIEVVSIDGSLLDDMSSIIVDTSLNDGSYEIGSSGSLGVPSGSSTQGGVATHGAAKINPTALEKIESLIQLFDWMEQDDYQFTERNKNIYSNFHFLFRMKSNMKDLANRLNLSNGYTFNNPEIEAIENFAELFKAFMLSYSDCFTSNEIERALSHDTPDNGWWWVGYWFFLGDLIESPFRPWNTIDDIQILPMIQQLLADFCVIDR
jgi:hypothetical protein